METRERPDDERLRSLDADDDFIWGAAGWELGLVGSGDEHPGYHATARAPHQAR